METLVPSTTPPGSAAELLDLLERSGGSLAIADPPESVRAAWRRLLHIVRSAGHVPSGWHLVQRGRNSGDLVLELRRGTHPSKRYQTPRRSTLPLPSDLQNAHPVVDRLRKQPDRLPTSEQNRSRALLLLQALATAATARGHTINPAAGDVLLTVVIDDSAFGVRLCEETGARWTLRLVLELIGPGDGPSRWIDYSRGRVEDELPAVLREMQRRARHEHALKEAARTAAKRERERVIGAHRDEILRRQVADWVLARDVRAHCADLVNAGMPAADRWLIWAHEYADTLDPLADPPGIPADPDPSATAHPASPSSPSNRDISGPARTDTSWHPNQRWYHR